MEKKNVHQGHRKRLREFVNKNGLEGMPEHQVLEYILSFVVPQKDTNIIAHRLINEIGDLPRILESNASTLEKVDGIGEVVAHFLANFRRMFEYYQKEKVKNITSINNTREAKNYIASFLRYKLVEELYVIGVDNKNNLVFTQKIASGTSNKNNVSIRSITEYVMHYKVNNIIIAHNHPEGEAIPSPEDDRFTRALVCSMMINSVHVMDHIIITMDSYYSYFHNNKFESFKEEFKDFIDDHAVAQNKAHYEVAE